MKTLLTLLFATLCAATGYGQTMKALSYNASNGVVAYSGTNTLEFTNKPLFASGISVSDELFFVDAGSIFFDGDTDISINSSYTSEQWRNAIGLGATNSATFGAITVNDGSGNHELRITEGGFLAVEGTNELGSLDLETRGFTGGVFTFEQGLHSRGNIVITNQTATNNGILFIYRTNNEPFLGLANLIASNNTTISNETLFRVGTAEATNRSAQFGFRSTNTNGSGVAVFSVFGYNALMMVGADASTNAVIYSGGGTNNEVMTLIRDGATEFARPIRFSTNASTRPATNAPANTTNVAAWVEFRIGTNSYRAPLYQ
jgi:hypothetical protein